MWTCQNCREKIADDIDICWNCGTRCDGTADPSFQPVPSAAAARDSEGFTLPSDAERRLVKVASFWHPGEAWLARNRLAEAGILAFVADEQLITANWLLSAAIGGVAVEVRLADLESARAVLMEDRSMDLGEMAVPLPGPVCPQCGATELDRQRYWRGAVFLSLLIFGIPIPFPSRKCRCFHCKWVGRATARRWFQFRIANLLRWTLVAVALLSIGKALGFGSLKTALLLLWFMIGMTAACGPINHARRLTGFASLDAHNTHASASLCCSSGRRDHGGRLRVRIDESATRAGRPASPGRLAGPAEPSDLGNLTVVPLNVSIGRPTMEALFFAVGCPHPLPLSRVAGEGSHGYTLALAPVGEGNCGRTGAHE